VYRCYDTRLRHSERRKDVYLDQDLFSDSNESKTILTLVDEDCNDSGCSEEPDIIRQMEWIWQMKGQLVIISTPYRDGVHVATRPRQFLPIIDHLNDLHKKGYVHGDIRAYNMVFNNVPNAEERYQGWLIDFDYGGKASENVRYPSGYKMLLCDGERRGREGDIITYNDDWYALFMVMTHLYIWKSSSSYSYSKEEFLNIILEGENLRLHFQELSTKEDCRETNFKMLTSYVNNCDNDKHSYTLEPQINFQQDLIRCGFTKNEMAYKSGSKNATGSPQKQEKRLEQL
jgi:hypothetical protein